MPEPLQTLPTDTTPTDTTLHVTLQPQIEYWLLPYVNAIVDALQAQSAAGAVPHVLGIFTGHVYHFFTCVWPAMGGKRYLTPPKAFKSMVGEEGKKKVSLGQT